MPTQNQEIKERPILFSGEMVKAILAGNKTQTRRIVKRNASGRVEIAGKQWHIEDENATLASPYGQRGDRLWVKETHALNPYVSGEYIYRATEPDVSRYITSQNKWKPSIFCTRNASRINLEITAVRVQRLQEISEHDAEAEGCSHDFLHSDTCSNDNCALCGGVGDCEGVAVSAKENYRALWERINGKGSWDANPWVWSLTFRIKYLEKQI